MVCMLNHYTLILYIGVPYFYFGCGSWCIVYIWKLVDNLSKKKMLSQRLNSALFFQIKYATQTSHGFCLTGIRVFNPNNSQLVLDLRPDACKQLTTSEVLNGKKDFNVLYAQYVALSVS